ncbi:hypothetical protein ASE73_09445 [Sphingomonas sp. Leaf24]|uniref:cupin domain-containing protein n=1 Tax=unclassified Sphingomonas TaxID=196159 RepID=UPI0006FE1109|nr:MULTISPECIES: cupin domain-containing protein [unclassified Sphingomonas]KQM17194.1 hypothetical protein ASE50_07495 [Sphingomonas sp. Leaf5]KQM88086.1 hypothetical protein ASE73_09445 [Sphingomonas sp. Leaf24]
MIRTLSAILLASLTGVAAIAGQDNVAPASEPAFFIKTVTEQRVDRLPADRPLYWRIETFPDAAAALAHKGEYALPASVEGRHLLFTLGARGGATPGGTKVAEIGPIPVPTARTYLLRINHAGGPPGAQTPVHTHPGAEAIYVLNGEVTQRTYHGTETAGPREALNAHGAEMAMQLRSSGRAGLSQLVMFVVDADRPFSPPAKF